MIGQGFAYTDLLDTTYPLKAYGNGLPVKTSINLLEFSNTVTLEEIK